MGEFFSTLFFESFSYFKRLWAIPCDTEFIIKSKNLQKVKNRGIRIVHPLDNGLAIVNASEQDLINLEELNLLKIMRCSVEFTTSASTL